MNTYLNATNFDTTDSTPKIFIESLADYNNGKSIGEWIEVSGDVEDLQAEINRILDKSQYKAEEWAIHDSENFEPFEISQYEGLESIVRKANILEELDNSGCLEAFEIWWEYQCINLTVDEGDIIENFHEEYRGEYDNEEDYAHQFMNDCYEIPEHLKYYIDYEAVWRDLSYDGYWSEYKNGTCYIFGQ